MSGSKSNGGPGGLIAWWQGASSWLASAVVHLIIVLVLGLLTLSVAEKSTSTELTATLQDEDTLELEDAQFEGLIDEEELDQSPALAVEQDDPGVAMLGEAASALDAEVSELGTLSIAETMGDIGTLFGDEGQGFASTGEGAGGATFFGVKAGGNRFAFVVDASSSMRRNGWEACRRELIAAVARLKPHQSFYVILFNHRPHPMFSDENPQRRPLRATPENLARLRKWVYAFRLNSGTMPMASMKLALSMRPDAIYFLTDGRLHDDTEGYLKKNNKRKDAYDYEVRASTVQTIGFYTEDGRAVLERIAHGNGGTFRYVPRPPGAGPNRPGQRGRR